MTRNFNSQSGRTKQMRVIHTFSHFVILTIILLGGLTSTSTQAAIREYWIAAEKMVWDYAPDKKNQIDTNKGLDVWGETLTYHKYRYVQYQSEKFIESIPQPEWMGILGPQIKAEVGDTIKVHFLNRTDRPLSIHPHGVQYDKANEGADGGPGSMVLPEKNFTYTWLVDEASGPGPNDSSSIVWLYHSHVVAEEEMNLGLIGTIVITKQGMGRSKIDPTPRDVDQEFTALYMIFDEEEGNENGLKHTINGRIFGNLEGFETTLGERVRWHIVALGNEEDNHTVHWHGHTVLHQGRRTDVIEVLPASMMTVDMLTRTAGNWLFHCHVNDHMIAGMSTRWIVHAKQ